MKYTKQTWAAALAVAAAVVSDTDVHAASEEGVVTASTLYVRNTPSATGKILGTLAKGTRITVDGQTNGWGKVQFQGHAGYVSMTYVKIEPAPAAVQAKVTASRLNVRSAPAVTGTIVGTVNQGTILTILKQEGMWAQISYNGQAAYVSQQYLEKASAPPAALQVQATVAVPQLNVRSAPSLQGAIAGRLKQGDSVTVTATQGDWSRITYQGSTAYVFSAYLQQNTAAAPAVTRTIAVPDVSLYQQPSYDSVILGTWKQGQTASVLGTEGEWTTVQYNGGKAYIPTLAFTAPVQEEKGTVKVSLLNVRSAPSVTAGIIGRLKQGDEVMLAKQSNGWGEIIYEGRTAYIALDYISLTADEAAYRVVTASQVMLAADGAAAARQMNATAADCYVTRNGTVVNMKQGFVRTKGVTNVYEGETDRQLTYVAANTDLEFVRVDGTKVYVKIEGQLSYVKGNEVTLFPSLLQEPTSYYKVKDGRLYYYVYKPGSGYFAYETAHAPAHLEAGRSYSAFNQKRIGNQESYAYFTYLSLRTPASYTGEELDAFIRALRPDSPLIGTGKYFVAAAERYHVNAGYLLSHAIVESAWGTSRIAREKKNLFGFQAVDANPYDGAASFKTWEEGILYCAKYISEHYLTAGSRQYRGAMVGDKAVGMNVLYASDATWGRQISSLMYKLDMKFANRDFGTYKLATVQSGAAMLASIGGTKVKTADAGIIVTIKRSVSHANGSYYEIVSDSPGYESLYVAAAQVQPTAVY